MKNIFIIGSVIVLLLIGSTYFINNFTGSTSSNVSTSGIHWHPTLAIHIDGERIEIPANIGLSGIHSDIHTHNDSDDVREAGLVEEGHKPIHMEIVGVVKEEQTQLGEFFKIWGKTFNSNCIFDNCIQDGNALKMLVNGEENILFEKYPMKDRDRIEIFYTSESKTN
jgi:hypothetical protein